jgi:hypothetical protein
MHRHFCAVVGTWKLENWRLYRYRPHKAASGTPIYWMQWDRVL